MRNDADGLERTHNPLRGSERRYGVRLSNSVTPEGFSRLSPGRRAVSRRRRDGRHLVKHYERDALLVFQESSRIENDSEVRRVVLRYVPPTPGHGPSGRALCQTGLATSLLSK